MSQKDRSPHRLNYRLAGPLALVALLASASVSGAAPQAPAEEAQRQVEGPAAQLADRVLTAMGGGEAWQNTRFLRFEFFGFRLHHWDRHTGRHRMEGKTREGTEYVVLHNVNERGAEDGTGQVWLNGEPAGGDERKEWLTRAWRGWINDTYWLIMPYKLRDPGVNLALDGEEVIDGVTYTKLLLTFNEVGVTPGDKYWAYINPETHLMDRWAYHLEGWPEDRPATHWQWLDWDRYGDILLAPRRVNVADDSEQALGRLAVFDVLPDSVFQSPAPVEVD